MLAKSPSFFVEISLKSANFQFATFPFPRLENLAIKRVIHFINVDFCWRYLYSINGDKIYFSELNCSEFSWSGTRDCLAFIKVNCISTEFTQKKHGGEKGAGFRLQVDVFKEEPSFSSLQYTSQHCLQACSCQIRIFRVIFNTGGGGYKTGNLCGHKTN